MPCYTRYCVGRPMNRNLIRNQRKALGLTQQQLAHLVGTSQQQVQRIEAGAQTIRLDLAVSIAEALKSSLTDLFPGLHRRTKRRASSRSAKPETSENRIDQLRTVGIDPDPAEWTLKFDIQE